MSRRLLIWIIAVGLLAALPPVATALGQAYYIDLVRRIIVLSIGAISLNLILGYGGLVSFGHAAYLGIGAYAVGILGFYGVGNGWLHLLVAVGASALIALAIGAISIRTSGIYFIMITLAFTQMLYYLGISLEQFGGDDGMRLKSKSDFGGLFNLANSVHFYYVALVVMVIALLVVDRIVRSRFGMVLQAAKSNEARSRALGYSPYPYRLAAFVLAGAIGGVSGMLYGNHTGYITPGLMSWHQSGELMFMVILGGMGTAAGPVLGTFALIGVEEVLKSLKWTAEHWQVVLGPLLVLSVIFFRRGLAGIFSRSDD